MKIITLLTAIFCVGWMFPLGNIVMDFIYSTMPYQRALLFALVIYTGMFLEFFRQIRLKASVGRLFLYFILSIILLPTIPHF